MTMRKYRLVVDCDRLSSTRRRPSAARQGRNRSVSPRRHRSRCCGCRSSRSATTTSTATGWVALLLLTTATLRATVLFANGDNDFDPYVMNGGLVAAVAGRDYLVVACDARLAGAGGYDIAERHHVSSRLWSPLATATATSSSAGSSSSSGSGRMYKNGLVAPDGSLAVDLLSLDDDDGDVAGSTSTREGDQPLVLLAHETVDEGSSAASSFPAVWIGSAGCMADCEHLKRDLRADLRAAQHFGDVAVSTTTAKTTTTTALLCQHVAVALSQTLYSRRGFPYYAFCLCAGIGQVFAYDAVGSYEPVAAACTGTGRSLLQPILDRKFRAAATTSAAAAATTTTAPAAPPSSPGGGVGSVPATVVDCESPERAVRLLLEGYRSVAEREIGVGDRVVFCTVQRKGAGQCECKIWTARLKKH